MNFYDFIIIYLACGAPVGVYYYLQNRRLYSKQLWLKSILIFVFWIPFFVQLIQKSRIRSNFSKIASKSKINPNASNDRIQILKREMEDILNESDLNISIYEFREVFERFAGLTLARKNNQSNPYKHEKEFYRVASFQNREISAGCLHRRNQKRLYFHQTEAEKDFLKVIAGISNAVENPAQMMALTLEFVGLLNNFGEQKTLIKIFDSKLQTNPIDSVKDLEKDLWMPETLKPQTAKPRSMRLQAVERTAKSFVRD